MKSYLLVYKKLVFYCSYVEALKSENESLKTSTNTSDPHEGTETAPNSTKKMAELEKTVFVLKRVVEKLQAENKRLLGGSRLCTLGDRSVSYLSHYI